MSKRLTELDSLRGLAAFSVLLSHFALIFPIICDNAAYSSAPLWQRLVAFSPLHIVWAGHEAVMFFFVLSGFVLSLPYLGSKPPHPYGIFIAKRVLRIYSPYIVAVIATIGLRELCYKGDIPALSSWFNNAWAVPANWGIVRDHLILIGSFKNSAFDPVLWSLVHEMRISIIFPLLIYLVRRHGKTSIALACVCSAITWMATSLKFRGIISFEHDYFDTFHYVGMFIAGGLLAKHRVGIISWVASIRPRTKTFILVGAVLAYTNGFWLPYYGTLHIAALGTLFHKAIFQDWITTAGVAAFISISLGTRSASNFLSLAGIQYLGKISYSLYLLHAICLKTLITLFFGTLPLWGILILAFGAAFATATLSYYFIERPSIRLGQALARRFALKEAPAGSLGQAASNPVAAP